MDHTTLVDIFFTITAAAVIVITILLAIAVIYIITIASAIRRIVRTAEFAAEMVKEDIAELRQSIKTRGLTLGVISGFFKGLGRKHASLKRKK
jgi:hypothetical protein